MVKCGSKRVVPTCIKQLGVRDGVRVTRESTWRWTGPLILTGKPKGAPVEVDGFLLGHPHQT
jgi:hypothetical protein